MADTRWEKRQDIAGQPKSDTAGVNVTITTNVDKDRPRTDIAGKTSTDENLKERTKNLASETYSKGKSKIDENTNMTTLLRHAQYCLEDFTHPRLNVEKQIPVKVLSNAFGLVFLTEYKASAGVGGSLGIGLIIARKSNRKGWTGPCAIRMGGLSIGFQAGAQKTEHIIVLRDEEALKAFVSKGQLKLGGDTPFTVGPLGRDAEIPVNVNDKDYSSIYSYCMATGVHLGTSLEGQIIMIHDDTNEDYYGKKVSAENILFDKIDSLPTDRAYSSLTKLLDEYIQKKGQVSHDMFTSEESRREFDDYQSRQKFDKEKRKHITMDRLLRHARFNLEYFMNPKLNTDKQIPAKLLKNCYGWLFLTEFKGGAGVGGLSGAGFIIAHRPNEDECSQPCAVSIGDISSGFQLGIEKTEHFFVFCDEQVLKSFVNKDELNLDDFLPTPGPLGRDIDVSLNKDRIYSYSTSKGVYIGAKMENQKLNICNEWNEEYFGKRVSARDILFDKVKPEPKVEHKSYQLLMNLLKEYKKNQGRIEGFHWDEQDRKEDEEWHSSEKDIYSRKDETSEEESGNMRQLLCYARCTFEDFVNPNLGIERQIPIKLLSGAHAIVFLTEIKAGFVVGASLGRGIILARKQDKGWTGPCAISLGGLSVGWLAGAEKTEHIIVLRDPKVLETFLSNGQLKFGGDMSFAVGPLGRDANVAININDRGYAPIYSYSMSKGVYMGASLEGQLITIRNDTNEQYYEKKVTASEILRGRVESPDDKEYQLLCECLDKYICRDKTYISANVQKDQDKDDKFSSKKMGDQDKDKDDKFSSKKIGDQDKDDKFSSKKMGDQDKDDKFSSKKMGDQGKEIYSKTIVTKEKVNMNVGDQNKNKQNL